MADQPLQGFSLLVAEDNPINQEIARVFLSGAGAAITIAGDGAEAVDRARTAGPLAFSAALLDIEMPVMDGLSAMRLLRADPALAALPLIAMTGHAAEAERRACAEAGAVAHVVKPFTRESLVDAVLGVLAPERTTSLAPTDSKARTVGGLDLNRLSTIDAPALVTILGDPAFVARLLNQFRDNEATLADALDAALAKGDRAEAARLAHRLKGVAGNLRAHAVFSAASALENTLIGGQSSTGELLNGLSASLRMALSAAMADIDRARIVSAESGALATGGGFSPAQRHSELLRLMALLESWDLAAEALWDGVAGYFSGPDATALSLALAALDYGAAEGHARALIRGAYGVRAPSHPVVAEAPPRILVVDDAPENIRFVGRILGPLNADVSFAVGGVAGLDRARTLMPDLILLDVEMPDKSGYDVIRALKGARGTRHIPVIFLTGRSTEADEASGLELGAIDYVTKPFNASVVIARVRNQLQIVEYARKLNDLNAELKRRATTDPLTGLPNRRAFQDVAERELVRLRRFGDQLAVLMLDIDHFKNVNDTLGHDAGDEVLRAVADRLSAGVRKTDFLARLGGEEFAVLMPKTDMDGAKVVASRLLASISSQPIMVADGAQLTVTATIGVSLARIEDKDINSALKRADLALYEGKAAGRNRVVEAAGRPERPNANQGR